MLETIIALALAACFGMLLILLVGKLPSHLEDDE